MKDSNDYLIYIDSKAVILIRWNLKICIFIPPLPQVMTIIMTAEKE